MWSHLLDRALRNLVRLGSLTVRLPDGTLKTYGDGTEPKVTVHIADPALLRKLTLNPQLALGESYMDGTLTIDDDALHELLQLAIQNLRAGNETRWMRFKGEVRNWLRVVQQFNPATRSRQNVAHHYDLSRELYDLFLDQDRQYSCAYFRTPDDSLEQAQEQKKAHIGAKLLLQPGMRVLDIGCGWGGTAMTLARDYGVNVLGVTLSQEQHKLATERAEAAGLTDKVSFRIMDYREVTGQFDRIVSIGMFEHVGAPHYREFFRNLRERLTPDGVALIHTIGRAAPPGSTNPWIAKYIFPGGYVPAMSEVMAAIEKENLWPTDVEIWRLHYAETLRHWHDRFMARRDAARALYDERFCRMWRYYLVACEQTFRFNRQCVFQFQIARDQNVVPLVRDYMYRDPVEALTQAAE